MTLSRVFVYGTLQDERVVTRVVGHALRWHPAVLEGYRRTVDKAIGYPVIRPVSGSRVRGRLLEPVDAPTLAALDAYEGLAYRRVALPVQAGDGRPVDAFVYVPADRRRARVR